MVLVIRDLINSLPDSDAAQTSCLCLTIVRQLKCVFAEMLGTSSLLRTPLT